MKIKMKKTEQGSEDGINVRTFKAGEEYTVHDNLGRVFVDVLGVAEKVEENAEVKSAAPAPENKMIEPAENKEEEPRKRGRK